MNSVTLDIIIYSLWGAGALILIFLLYQLWVARNISKVFKEVKGEYEDEDYFEQLGGEFRVNIHEDQLSKETKKWVNSKRSDILKNQKIKIAPGNLQQSAIEASVGLKKGSSCCNFLFVKEASGAHRCQKCNKFCKVV